MSPEKHHQKIIGYFYESAAKQFTFLFTILSNVKLILRRFENHVFHIFSFKSEY